MHPNKKITDEELLAAFEKYGFTASITIGRALGLNDSNVRKRRAKLVAEGRITPSGRQYPPSVDTVQFLPAVPPRILFYDIETSPLQAWLWQPGKQYVGHKQLVKNHSRWGIICITYCWNDGEPAKSVDWGYREQDTKRVIEEFDKIAATADLLVGKNSDNFDAKMINSARMFADLPGNPVWAKSSDDLQKQMKKYFRMPSQSLDYYSRELGIGGKIKMEMQDWIDIVERNANGQASLDKMIKYGKKDVEDTRILWKKLSEHFDSKFNSARFQDLKVACKHADCGSTDLKISKHTMAQGNKYREYMCNTCYRYAGRQVISSVTLNPTGTVK